MRKAQRQLHSKDRREGSKTLKWSIIVSSVVTGLLADYFVPGWGRPVLITLLVFGSLVGFCHSYWSTPFWTVAIAMFAVHSALVFRFRVAINEISMPGLFLCVVAEVVVIAIILGLVFPDRKEPELRHL